MHSLKSLGRLFIILMAYLSCAGSIYVFSIAVIRDFGFCVNNRENFSRAHSMQCNASSGNIFRVHWGISPSSYGSLELS